MTERARVFDGKKYMWDGEEYEADHEAAAARERYVAAGFEVQLWHDHDRAYLYTRRTITEVVVDGG